MPRNILVENHSGFIWGDSADTKGYKPQRNWGDGRKACHLARMVDRDIGDECKSYEFESFNPRDTRAGYHVYQIDRRSLPVVDDGQCEKAIGKLRAKGTYIGFVERIDND